MKRDAYILSNVYHRESKSCQFANHKFRKIEEICIHAQIPDEVEEVMKEDRVHVCVCARVCASVEGC